MADLLPSWRTSTRLDDLYPFGRIRLIALDVDGTLLSSSTGPLARQISDLQSSLRHYRRRVTVTVATGRTLLGVERHLAAIGIARTVPVIIYNGAVVTLPSSSAVLFHASIPRGSIAETVAICREFDAPVFVYRFLGGTLMDQGRERVMGWSRQPNRSEDANGVSITWCSPGDLANAESATTILVEVGDDDPGRVARLASLLDEVPGQSTTRSGARFLEVRPRGVDKGRALEVVAKHMGLTESEVLAVGDADNDAEMLGWAGIGVAVAGASARAKAAADFEAFHPADEGVIEILRLVEHAARVFRHARDAGSVGTR